MLVPRLALARPSRRGYVKDFCPNCGVARVGAFRFCFACRLDFDTLGTDQSSRLAAVPTAELVKVEPIAAGGNRARRLPGHGLLAVGLAFAVGIAALGSVTEIGPRSPASAVAVATATQTTRPFAAAIPSVAAPPAEDLTSGPTGQTTEANVIGVLNGATIVVAFGSTQRNVRYLGLDTPETVDPSDKVAWMGPRATAANKALVAGKTVVLEKDVSETDEDGRLLRYVWLTDGVAWTLVNLELVKDGVAAISPNLLDVKYVDVYLAAQRNAQASRAGLWGAKPALKPAPKAKTKPITKPEPKSLPKPAKPKPKPTAKPKPNSAAECDPSSDPCVPIVGDLKPPDVGATDSAPPKVTGRDDHPVEHGGDGTGSD
jgi:endonuclease YncB( thermonuclease family)